MWAIVKETEAGRGQVDPEPQQTRTSVLVLVVIPGTKPVLLENSLK